MAEKSLEEELALLREEAPEIISFLQFLKPVMQENVDINFTLIRTEQGFGRLFMHRTGTPAENAGDKHTWSASVMTLSPSFMKTIVDKD
jgi:hypothetical protein